MNLQNMKRWKKFLLVLLILVLLTQIPFAYRRYRLGRLQAAIRQLNAVRVTTPNDSGFLEYKGVVHVHSFLGGHSTGSFEEIIAGAKSNRLDFVVMTEHTSENFNTAAMTLKGMHAGILFVNGNEVNIPTAGRVLLVPGLGVPGDDSNPVSLEQIVKRGRGNEGLTFVTYPQEFRGWETTYFDGIEVYNVYTNARQINPFVMFFDGLWSYRSYPELLFANFFRRPSENLAKWDQVTAATGRKVVAIAGNDAHANVGFKIDSESGQQLIGLKLDPYERSFRLVRVHVLLAKDKTLDSQSLMEALRAGHCFIGFDLFGETSGFSFQAKNGSEQKIQGDDVFLAKEAQLTVVSPVPARIILFKDGKPMLDETGITKKDYPVTQKGIYRVEVYLPQLQKPVGDQPWIISNPIYVK